MHILMLDTCVWLELASKKSEMPALSIIEYVVVEGTAQLLIPDIVRDEFIRNKERVADKTRQRLNRECDLVSQIIESFGGDKKQEAIDAIADVKHRLPILSEANHMTINRVEKLFDNAISLTVSDSAKLRAANRAISKLAPFHKSKNSMADASLIECFHEFVLDNKNDFESFRFVTLNHTDFSDSDHRQPHPDLAALFDQTVTYHITPNTALHDIAEFEDGEDEEFEWEQETRGLIEILREMDELTDKIWYNRHCNRVLGLEEGTIELVPDYTERYGNDVMHESLWQGALEAARKIEELYEDTGPWSDFEWGMINGKLSALRWVLGDEWDNLDT